MATRNGTPLDIPSGTVPQYYFDPSQTSTGTLSSTGKYASRADLSGNGLTATCPDGDGSAPSPQANAIGGLTAISYNQSSGYDLVYIVNQGTTLTAAAVIQTVNSNNYARLMSVAQKLGGGADWNTITGFDLEQVNGASQINLQRNQVLAGPASFTQNVPFIAVCQFDGTNEYLYINGNFIASAASSGNFDISSSTFGLSNTRGNGFTGLNGSQLLYSQYLSTADRQWIEGCLAWQWDGGTAGTLVGALPSNHPYKSSRPTVSSGGTGSAGAASGSATATSVGAARAASTATASGVGAAAATSGASGATTGAASGSSSATTIPN